MEKKKKFLRVVMMDVDPEYEEEFNRWYNEEHLPQLVKVPGALSGRRYKVVPFLEEYGKKGFGRIPKYMTIYEHESIDIPNTEAFKKANFTPWTERMSPHIKNSMKTYYVQIFPEEE